MAISPEEKYLLLLLLKKYGVGKKFTEKVSDISNNYGVTRNVVVGLMSTLEQDKCVDVLRDGHRQKHYTFKSVVVERFDKEDLIKRFLQDSNPVLTSLIGGELSIQDEKLRVSNRLFLACLVVYADEFGVVRDLSSTALRKMMGGISEDRFSSQLKTIKRTGIIKRYVAGVTGKELFGKSDSKYYLNLEHPLLDKWPYGISTVSLEFNRWIPGTIPSDYFSTTELTVLFDAYRQAFNPKTKNLQEARLERLNWPDLMMGQMSKVPLMAVMPLFRNHRLHDQLHDKICSLASECINYRWRQLEDVDITRCSDKVKELFSLEHWVPRSYHDACRITCPSTQERISLKGDKLLNALKRNDTFVPNGPSTTFHQYLMFFKLMLSLAFLIAARYRALLTLTVGDVSTARRYCILPVQSEGKPCLKHQVLFTGNEQIQTHIVVDSSGKVSCESKAIPIDIDDVIHIFTRPHSFFHR
ncbi:hypothetical protein PP645_001623 [Vibrio vulnificus]|nr:hypothetical protein [Vibrio vulnificus]